jgi:hypothetical protein
MNSNTARLFNLGEAGSQFTYRTITNASQFGNLLTDGITGVNLTIDNHANITQKEDICLALSQLISNVDGLGYAGNIGMKLVDVNTVKVFNTGSPISLKYFTLSNEAIEHGIAQFAGINDYTTINIEVNDEITHSSNICMMITPLVDDDGTELGNVGEISFKAMSNTEIRVYNTGNNASRFKWAVVKGNSNNA